MLMPADITSPGAAIHQTLESGSSSHHLNGAAENDVSYVRMDGYDIFWWFQKRFGSGRDVDAAILFLVE